MNNVKFRRIIVVILIFIMILVGSSLDYIMENYNLFISILAGLTCIFSLVLAALIYPDSE